MSPQQFADNLANIVNNTSVDVSTESLLTDINAFWKRAETDIVGDNWENDPAVVSVLNSQKVLEERLKSLPNELETLQKLQVAHHAFFYHSLSRDYNNNGQPSAPLIPLEPLTFLIQSTCRMANYGAGEELNNYPLTRLQQKADDIEAYKQTNLVDGFTTQMTFLSLLCILMNNNVTATQQKLLARLSEYRQGTTDEERRSEKALIAGLSDKSDQYLNLLTSQEAHLNTAKFKDINLNAFKTFIPKTIGSLKTTLNKMKTTAMHNGRTDTSGSDEAMGSPSKRQDKTREEPSLINQLNEAFSSQYQNQAPITIKQILAFSEAVFKNSESLTLEKAQEYISAAYIVCLQQYIALRDNDPKPDSLLSFSKKTKCAAANRLISIEKNETPESGVRARLATQEGRLKQLVEKFKEFKTEIAQRKLNDQEPPTSNSSTPGN